LNTSIKSKILLSKFCIILQWFVLRQDLMLIKIRKKTKILNI
jgi:hypothetical protein